jgi:hypothetical protein
MTDHNTTQVATVPSTAMETESIENVNIDTKEEEIMSDSSDLPTTSSYESSSDSEDENDNRKTKGRFIRNRNIYVFLLTDYRYDGQ